MGLLLASMRDRNAKPACRLVPESGRVSIKEMQEMNLNMDINERIALAKKAKESKE